MRRLVLTALFLTITGAAQAQSAQPYAGMQTRAIKALPPSQIEDLRAGRGMGLALAGELNGYPGPMHVIELADNLSLNADQRAQMQTLFVQMKNETIPIGERLIHQESELDRMFAERTVTPASLNAAADAIGRTQGALRAAHLSYYLKAAAILTPAQTTHYAELRGYGAGTPHHGGHHRPRH